MFLKYKFMILLYYTFTFSVFRWSVVSLNTQLFDDDQQTNINKTKSVKSCQRALKFFSTSESVSQQNLFNTKPSQKELSKLHKQVCIRHTHYITL